MACHDQDFCFGERLQRLKPFPLNFGSARQVLVDSDKSNRVYSVVVIIERLLYHLD